MKYERYIKDGMLCWTLTSNGYKYLTWNFVVLWREACKGQPILVVCADKPSYQFLQREGVSCVLYDNFVTDFGPQVVPFGSRQFSVLNKLKLKLLQLFAEDETVKQCVYLDGDIAVYKHIPEDMRVRLGEAPLWMQCDEQPHECTATAEVRCPNTCSGLIAFNHGGDGGIFKITDEAVWSAKPEDQVWVNYAARNLNVPVAVLPRNLYPNGARASLTKGSAELKEAAFCLHYNYRVGGVKIADMKRFGDWRLPY
jgi:hypothetical protein